MVSAAKSSISARDLSRAPTAYTAFQNSTSHTALLPRIMGADGVVFLCSFQDNMGPIGRARLDREQINGQIGQQNKGKVRRCSARAPLRHIDAESSEIEMGTQGSCRLMTPPPQMPGHPGQPMVLPDLSVVSVKGHLVSTQQLREVFEEGAVRIREVPCGMLMALECPHVAEGGSLPRPKTRHGQS